MARGDIFLITLPRPVGELGHEQYGDRPAVVIQDDDATANLLTVVVVPITSNLSATKFPGSVLVKANRTNGLHKQSVILTHQIVTIDRRWVGRRIGKLPANELKSLEDSIRRFFRL